LWSTELSGKPVDAIDRAKGPTMQNKNWFLSLLRLSSSSRRSRTQACRRATFFEPLEGRCLLANIGLNFTGTVRSDQPASSVPDTMGGVGPAHVVELINDAYAIYNKADGSLVARIDDDIFWNNALAAGGGGAADHIVDPRIIYDHASQRWFASALDRLSTPARNILVGVSSSSDPTAPWRAFLIDPDPTDLYFADFPTLGVDADGVYIQANMFDYQPDGITPNPQIGTTIISIPKADLVAATPSVAGATVFADVDPNVQTNPFTTMQPAVDFGPSDGRQALIAQGGSLLRTNILNAAGPGPATYTNRTVISVPFNFEQVDAPQPGTATLIETGASFLRSNIFEQGDSLWITYGEVVAGRAGVRWIELHEPTNAVLQTGTIGHPDLHFYYPSISANEFGDVVIGFSGSSNTQYASAYAIAGTTTGGVTTFGDVMLLQAGQGTFLAGFAGPVRWGDYSATVRDPNDPRVFWTFQEFVSAVDDWGIQISQISFNPVAPNESPNVDDQTFSVAENSANGTSVGTVLATDPDAGQSLSFAITGGNTGGAFAINSATGQITVASAGQLDFETTPQFLLTVQVIDSGTPALSDTATITVDVLDVNESPNVNNQSFSVAENSAGGTSVGTVVATDPDAGQSLSYAITGGNTGGAFAINSSTGQITVASASQLDFENASSFSLTVQVTDSATPPLSDTATITVNVLDVNESPNVNNQSFSVAENSASGTSVGTVVATDPDAGQSLSFAITGGNTGGAFAINSSTGQITVASASQLDYETTPQFLLTVQVTDSGSPAMSSTATMTINLIDRIEIDIDPADSTNTINLKADKEVAVAILSNSVFDATTQINVNSLRFGKTGGEDSLVRQRKTGAVKFALQDVNGDGFLDLVVYFQTSKTGLQPGDSQAVLTGLLTEGASFEVRQGVQVVSGTGKGGGKGNGQGH